MAALIFNYFNTFFVISTGEDMDINSLFMTQTKLSLYYYSRGYNKNHVNLYNKLSNILAGLLITQNNQLMS